MVTAAITTRVETVPSVRREASPLSMILVTPKIERVDPASSNITITAPDNELTEITSANEAALLGDGFARAAYDYIESGSSVRVWVLPFTVDVADALTARRAKVVTALGVLDNQTERDKLPHRRVNVLVVPRETAVAAAADANTVYAAAAQQAAHLGAVVICDAGHVSEQANVDAVVDVNTQAEVIAWEALNSVPDVLAVTNRQDITGYTGMWGSVIAAAHYARQTSLHGIHYSPANLRDHILGGSATTPARDWDPSDGSSAAEVLARTPHHLTSIIQWEGAYYLYGGRTSWPENDPRYVLSNSIVLQNMLDEARRDTVGYLGLRANATNVASLQLHIQNDLDAQHLGRGVRRIEVLEPLRSGDHTDITFETFFFNFINSVRLTARISNA